MNEDWPYTYFTRNEMKCKCGCGCVPQAPFMKWLDTIREECGFALPVISGFRCAEYNNAVADSGFDGPHTFGLAADIQIHTSRAFRLLQVAIKHGVMGIGVRQKLGSGLGSRVIHLDLVPAYTAGFTRPTIWSY